MFGLLPKEDAFFELFERASANVHLCAGALVELVERWDDVENRVRKIKDLEHNGDQITHDTIEKLNTSFITPIDRQDIHELICRLDDIADMVDTTAHRMIVYRVKAPTEDCKKLASCLRHATGVIVEAIPLLRNMKDAPLIRQKCIAIHTRENEADQLLAHALGSLFDKEPDAREILKWKDIYQEIESATDRCEDVANVLDSIVLKNA
jgi:predicted phosphate transport protein (TIGR00153 family)